MGFIRLGETKASCLLSSPALSVCNRCTHRFLISTKPQHFVQQSYDDVAEVPCEAYVP